MQAERLLSRAGTKEAARLATWSEDFAKDRFFTQVAKRERVRQLTAEAQHAEHVGQRLDQIAAGTASASAWVVPHVMPHAEHQAPHGVHEPQRPHVEPVHP